MDFFLLYLCIATLKVKRFFFLKAIYKTKPKFNFMNNFFRKSFEGKNKWYNYLAVFATMFVGGQIVGSIPYMIYKISSEDNNNIGSGEIASTTELILALLVFNIMFYFLYLGITKIQNKRFTSIITGRKKIDFRRIFIGAGLWGAIMIAFTLVDIAAGGEYEFRFDLQQFLPLLIVSIVFIPLQAALEEVVIRGTWMQGIFLLFRKKWVALLLTTIIFALMHSSNPEIEKFGYINSMAMYAILGLTMGLLTILDDGLELAIGIHTINNILASAIISSEGSVLSNAGSLVIDKSSEITLMSIISLALGNILLVFLAKKIFKFKLSTLKDEKTEPMADQIEIAE